MHYRIFIAFNISSYRGCICIHPQIICFLSHSIWLLGMGDFMLCLVWEGVWFSGWYGCDVSYNYSYALPDDDFDLFASA